MKVCSVRLLVFSLLLFGGAVAAALNLKEAPESGIFDEAQFLDERFISDIGYRINYERTHREFEVFVIVFDEEPTQGAKILAKQAGESWSKGGILGCHLSGRCEWRARMPRWGSEDLAATY